MAPVILIAGSRGFHNYPLASQKITTIIARLLSENLPALSILEGGANGTDCLAFCYAFDHDIPCITKEADWDTHGKRAGMIRNGEMVELATHAIIFWDYMSKGTLDTITRVRKKGIPYRIIRVENTPEEDRHYGKQARYDRLRRKDVR